eukprot:6955199-Prymnesium_polylepis.1
MRAGGGAPATLPRVSERARSWEFALCAGVQTGHGRYTRIPQEVADQHLQSDRDRAQGRSAARAGAGLPGGKAGGACLSSLLKWKRPAKAQL